MALRHGPGIMKVIDLSGVPWARIQAKRFPRSRFALFPLDGRLSPLRRGLRFTFYFKLLDQRATLLYILEDIGMVTWSWESFSLAVHYVSPFGICFASAAQDARMFSGRKIFLQMRLWLCVYAPDHYNSISRILFLLVFSGYLHSWHCGAIS